MKVKTAAKKVLGYVAFATAFNAIVFTPSIVHDKYTWNNPSPCTEQTAPKAAFIPWFNNQAMLYTKGTEPIRLRPRKNTDSLEFYASFIGEIGDHPVSNNPEGRGCGRKLSYLAQLTPDKEKLRVRHRYKGHESIVDLCKDQSTIYTAKACEVKE